MTLVTIYLFSMPGLGHLQLHTPTLQGGSTWSVGLHKVTTWRRNIRVGQWPWQIVKGQVHVATKGLCMSPWLDADVGRSHGDRGSAAHATRDACIRVCPDIAVSDIVSSRHDIGTFFPILDPIFVISAFERFESVFRRAPPPATIAY